MERESGYYWVKETNTGAWLISFYEEDLNRWFFINDPIKYEETALYKINETRILPPQN